MLKIVLDTNIIISALITNSNLLKRLIDLQSNKRLIIYSSPQIYAELQITIQKPKIKELIKVNSKKVASFLAWYKYQIKFETPASIINVCRDPKDNMFLELCEKVNADYLVTGDNDLLILKENLGCKIVKPADFILDAQL